MRTSHRSFRIFTWVFGLALAALFSLCLDVSAGERKPRPPLPRKGDKEKAAAAAAAAEKAAQPVKNFIYTEIREFRDVKIDDAKEKELDGTKSKVFTILKAGKPANAAEKKMVDDYMSYCVVRMTWEKNIADLPKRRDEITSMLETAGRAPDNKTAHSQLLENVIDLIPEIAEGNDLHPATRYSAILLATELNQTESEVGGREAVPYAPILPEFLNRLADVGSPMLVKVGAMVGVSRHSEFPMTDGTRGKVAAEMEKFIVIEAPNPTPIQGWMRRRALGVIRNMALKAPDWKRPGMPEMLAKLLADPKVDMPTRAVAALTLGALGAEGMKPADVTVAWKNLGEMAIDITEIKPAGTVDGDAGDAAAEDELETKPFRDGVAYYLTSVRIALEGIKPALPAGDQEKFDTLKGKVQQMINECGNRKLSEPNLAGELVRQGASLGDWLDTLKAPAEGAPVAAVPTPTAPAQ